MTSTPVTIEWLDFMSAKLKAEDPQRYQHMPSEEVVFEDFCDVAKEFPKGDLTFAQYVDGISVLYELPEVEKIKPTALTYLLASASLSDALTQRGIEPTWLAKHYPALPISINEELVSALAGADAVAVGHLCVAALSE